MNDTEYAAKLTELYAQVMRLRAQGQKADADELTLEIAKMIDARHTQTETVYYAQLPDRDYWEE